VSAPLPRTIVKELKVSPGEVVHITPISDAHLDDSLCDYGALEKLMNERRALPNHRVIWIGDTANLVLPNDMKRFRSSVAPAALRGVDAYLNETTDYLVEKIAGLGVTSDMFSPGNHEDELIKRSGYDMTSVLAKEFSASRGGYSGAIDYRLRVTKTASATFTVVYHHGAWGGKANKGYTGAKDFFGQFAFPWHVGVYGHNHSSRLDVDVSVTRRANGDFVETPRYIVNCSSWVRPYADDALQTHYAERAGYVRQPMVAPLIKVTPRWTRDTNRNSNLVIDYGVEM